MRLSIETSGVRLSVALTGDAGTFATFDEDIGRGHAERLVPVIASIMACAGVQRADEVTVCVGPGSFTGIRIGIAAARALGLAWGVPVYGFTAMALLAMSAELEDDCPAEVLTVRDAARGELFVQHFALEPMRALAPVEVVSPQEARRRAETIGAWVGDLPEDRGIIWSEDFRITASGVGLLPEAFRTLGITPLYIRSPDAKAAG